MPADSKSTWKQEEYNQGLHHLVRIELGMVHSHMRWLLWQSLHEVKCD